MTTPIDLTKLNVLPLSKRRSQARLEEILVDPGSWPKSISPGPIPSNTRKSLPRSTLDIAEVTVKLHVGHILAKLKASDRTQATTIALQRGIFHLD